MLVRLGKLLGGEEKSKEGDIDIGVHDEDGALYSTTATFMAIALKGQKAGNGGASSDQFSLDFHEVLKATVGEDIFIFLGGAGVA